MDLPPVPCFRVSHMPLSESRLCARHGETHVAAGKVTALKHELRDDAVELGASIAKALFTGAQGAEVLDGLGDDIVEELEVDAAGLVW